MKIWVLSLNAGLYSTKSLVDAGRARGHDVEVISYLNCNILIDKGHPAVMYEGKLITDLPNAIIPRIAASKTFYGCAVVRQFEMLKIFSSASSQAIMRSRDKLRSMQILSKHGLDMPHTAFASRPEDIKSLIKNVGGAPIVIKLLEGTQGKGVVLAESYKTAKSALDAFYGLKANILIQEFIKEAGGRDIRALVVGDKVVGSIERQGNIDDFRSNLHQGGTARPHKLTKQEKEVAIEAAKALGLDIAGVDILPSDRGPLIMEVNSSPGLQGIESALGKDIAGDIITLIEKRVLKPTRDKVGA